MSLNVLVVDDSSVVRKMIIKGLHLTDLPVGEVHEAADGQAALDVLESNWIDLVFADINMPVMDGEEMINRMRAEPALADVPVIVVSTEGSETRIERLRQLGARFIHKPFSPEELREVVTELVGATNEQQ